MDSIVNNVERYLGEYVAIRDFGSRDVLCSNKDPLKVWCDARDMGFDDPVVFYIPDCPLVL